MRKFIAVVLAVFVFITNSYSFAVPKLSKVESVYVNLDCYGGVEQINVYNDCKINGQSEITDFGVYEKVTNLINRTEPKMLDGKIVWDVNGLDRFAYSGKVSNENAENIPWSFEVSYKLNGVPIEAKDLVSKSGLVEVEVKINANGEAKEYYRNNYMLEVTGSYDLNKYLSVESDEAMFITTGRTKTLMHIVLPGQSTTIHIKIGSDDFEMDGLTFAMVPLEGDILEKIGDIVEDKNSVEDAMEELNSSADVILEALDNMNGSLDTLNSGMALLKDGTEDLHSLSPARDEAILKTKQSLDSMKIITKDLQIDLDNAIRAANNLSSMIEEIEPKLKSISKTMESVKENIEDIKDIVENLPDDMKEIRKTVDTSASLIGNLISLLKSQMESKSVDVAGLENALVSIAGETQKIGIAASNITPTDETELGALQQIGASAATIGTKLGEVEGILTDVKGIMEDSTVASSSMVNNLSSLKKHLNNISDMIDEDDGEVAIDTVDNICSIVENAEDLLNIALKYTDEYIKNKDDLSTAVKHIKQLINELDKLRTSVDELITNIQDTLKIIDGKIYSGTDKVLEGMQKTTEDLKKITKQSYSVKYSKDSIRQVVKNNWNDVEGKTTLFNVDVNATPISFLSDGNESPQKVQFMIKTADIKKIKSVNNDLENSDDDGNLWSRIVNILKKMFAWIYRLFNIKE